MPYQLNADVTFCRIDGTTIFLDTRADRYFRLTAELERAFHAYLTGAGDLDPNLDALLDKSVFGSFSSSGLLRAHIGIGSPISSVLESPQATGQPTARILLHVFAIICRTRWQLGRYGLHHTLSELVAYRERNARQESIGSPQESLLAAAGAYWRSRPLVPIEPRCLLDSIAMVRFLANRGMRADLVFGVTGNPFSAHAWAQSARIILTDSLGNASAHTPIRVV